MATTAAAATFRRVYNDPGVSRQSDADRLTAYALLWSYYNNSAFDNLATWTAYRQINRLYQFTRPLYNPARRLVDFYAGAIYAGKWTTDPAKMTDPAAAMPFEPDTPPALLAAVGQIWQWSNFPTQQSIAVRFAAAVGDCLLAIVDDIDRQKVYLDPIYPGLIKAIELDPRGNVEAYAVEFDTEDSDGNPYTYRREVNKNAITEYRDDTPASQIPNPYGFTPAVWINHAPTKAIHGEPAIRNIGKIDELNAFASHTLDQAHRILEAPILLSGDNINAGNLAGTGTPKPAKPRRQEEINIITAAAGATVDTITLDTGEALAHIDKLLAEIERDHPELGMYSKMREMSQITGPAADRLFGDVAALVQAARVQYDVQMIKALQMAVAVAGWRLAGGAWIQPDAQQRKFAPFGLDSYGAGDLDMAIQARPLVPMSEEEAINLERQRQGAQADQAYMQQQRAAAGAPNAIAGRIMQMMQPQAQQPAQPAQAAQQPAQNA